jgi:hypothetical protein
MPYGCLDSQKQSRASLEALERAVDWWQKSMQSTKHKTFFVLASYEEDGGLELQLRKQVLIQSPVDEEFHNNVLEIRAKDEEALANKIIRHRALLPIETITVFAESRHALSIRGVFKRKFRKALTIKTFKSDFEANHPWVSTSSSFAWFLWNVFQRVWFELKKKLGRNVRKKLRFLFRP